jgi:phenylalanine-4-hydroxylase
MEMNEILERLPRHLMSLVIDQPYNTYTAQDHAVWRYVMRQNIRYLSRVAYGSYLEGLRRTGISIDRIPHMYGMNRILKEIGWAAVAVDGFIPPSAFMEFQAYHVLVIAADIRPLDQIEYTPAPDIIHEAAGHAPIIADPGYAEYLRKFGWIGARAFSSARDYELYEAIRHLSILKADPYTPSREIESAERLVSQVEAITGIPSEMAQIRNLHWWTVEYGLIGDLKNPKIYGAGLLSSIGESYSALQPAVKKIPYSLDAVNYNFDITTKQPQLFVTPDFDHLLRVLDEYAATMALNKGGVDGILKAIGSGKPATCVYSSGLQVSGIFSEVITHAEDPVYIRTQGTTTLNHSDRLLPGHGIENHPHGFGSPVGMIKGLSCPPENATDTELEEAGIKSGEQVNLEFTSGVRVSGILESSLRKNGRLVLMTFRDCTVAFRGRIFFEPGWGKYDMAVGGSVISAFSGPADPDAFHFEFQAPAEKTHKIKHSPKAMKTHEVYDRVKSIRENGQDIEELRKCLSDVQHHDPDEWLLLLEILEIVLQKFRDDAFSLQVRGILENIRDRRPDLADLINNGLSVSGTSYQ